jgi:4'-phosphopantetheinyl transferase
MRRFLCFAEHLCGELLTPPEQLQITKGSPAMCEVVILTASPELAQTEFDRLLLLVAPEKQKRIKRFHFYRDARNALLGDILARTEICRATGLKNEQLDFSTNEYGKPFLNHLTPDGSAADPRIHFNISHTGNYIACAVADRSVGIDIESIKSVDLNIAERFFAPDEIEYVMDNNQAQRFFEVWTKKESRIKWEGKGLSKSLESFSVFDSEELEKLSYYEIFRNNEAICHVCLCDNEEPSVKMINTEEFLRHCK